MFVLFFFHHAVNVQTVLSENWCFTPFALYSKAQHSISSSHVPLVCAVSSLVPNINTRIFFLFFVFSQDLRDVWKAPSLNSFHSLLHTPPPERSADGCAQHAQLEEHYRADAREELRQGCTTSKRKRGQICCMFEGWRSAAREGGDRGKQIHGLCKIIWPLQWVFFL